MKRSDLAATGVLAGHPYHFADLPSGGHVITHVGPNLPPFTTITQELTDGPDGVIQRWHAAEGTGAVATDATAMTEWESVTR